MFRSNKLKKFNEINHCFFSRKGGFSKGIYAGLNCGRGSGDSKKNILKNLDFVSRKMKVRKDRLILMYQTHSKKVVEIKKNNHRKMIYSDAMITKLKGIALCVVTADCAPILIYDKKSKIIGCIHAGWKGAFKGIIKNTIKKIKKLNSKNKLYASIGPCIGKKSYEVDFLFYKKFIKKSKKNILYFSNKKNGKKLFNLRKFVEDKLSELNVKVDHVDHDTYAEKKNFYSYRRSSQLMERDYGRCLSSISLI